MKYILYSNIPDYLWDHPDSDLCELCFVMPLI